MSTAFEPLPADVTQPTGFLHTLLAMSLTAVAVLRPLYGPTQPGIQDFSWVYLNAAGQRLLQQPEVPAASLLALFPTAAIDGLLATCCRAFETGELQRSQTTYQTDELSGYFLLVAQRYDNLLVINFTDTNDQFRPPVEQTLRESQAREREARAEAERERRLLRALLAQAPVAIALFQGEEVRVATVNEQMAALWGRSSAQVLGRPLLEGVPELRGQGFDDMIRRVQATREPYAGIEAPATILQNGVLVVRYYNYSCQPIYGPQGEVLGVLNVGSEVTEQVKTRRQLEQLNQALETQGEERARQLRQQSQRLERLVQQAPAAIALLDGPDLVFELLNADYQALFPNRALLGKPVLEALPELAATPLAGILQGVYQTGVTFEGRDFPIPFAGPDGHPQTRYFDFIYQARYDAAGIIDGLVLFGFEVTEQVQRRQQVQGLNEQLAATNAELNTANTQLQHVNTDLDTFIYTASHDLRMPMANIEGLITALRQELLSESVIKHDVEYLLALMEQSVARFQTTIGHLTTSMHQQASSQALPPLDLAALVEDVRLDLAPLLAEARAELLVDVQACPTLHGPPKDLRSIVLNLLSNALKYRAPDRPARVQLHATCDGQWAELRVQDNGLGLSPAQQSQLFGLFTRLHDHVEGSGVGLYAIKRLVENRGGTIGVESALGVGSTFCVRLPV